LRTWRGAKRARGLTGIPGDGGRGVYFRDPTGHFLEMLTRSYLAETDESVP
jgi:hypothetical protein